VLAYLTLATATLLHAVSAWCATPAPARWPVPVATHGNRIDLVFGMPDYVRRLEQDLAGARRSVRIDFYVLGGVHGASIANLLVRRAREGLDVRVLLDQHLGTVPAVKRETVPVRALLERGRVPLRRPLLRRGGLLLHRWVEDHNKLAIIDGEIAYVGGTNIVDVCANYNDLMMRTRGPVVARLEEQFDRDWAFAGDPDGPRPDDVLMPPGPLLESRSAPGLSTVRVVGTGIGRATFVGAVVNALRAARSSVTVSVHQLNHDLLIDEIIRAHRRGVAVRILVDPSRMRALGLDFGERFKGVANAHAVVRLRAAGVPTRFITLDDGFDAYHMKLGLFDRQVLIAGSANWDRLGCVNACETDLEVAGGSAVPEIDRWLERTWRDHAAPARTGFLAHVVNDLARLHQVRMEPPPVLEEFGLYR
jgi:phosphatidylserine/phosphatidylglycerophosphate/cardiolipin synthase-like enzyme